MKAGFFSDAHLPDDDPERVKAVRTLLRRVADDADIVVILGDLFEFYHGFDGYIYPFYREIADTLRDLAALRSVYYVEGTTSSAWARSSSPTRASDAPAR
jgi:UDP-2,3-diacylglucosamine hydrolase